MSTHFVRTRLRPLASAAAAFALVALLPLPAAAADTTGPAVTTPVLSASTVNQGAPVSVATTATDPSGVVSTQIKVDSGAWSFMSPGVGGNVTTSRNGAALVNAAVAHVRAGSGFTCAQMVGGTIRCWGDNGSGQLGDGTNTSSTFPVAVTGISTSSTISVGAAHACARLSNATIRCWGGNGSGQLGNGSNAPSSTSVAVTGITTAVSVAAGANHSCAVLTDKTVRCWGANTFGQLGDGSGTNKSTPVAVSGITTAIAVTTGDSHSCALLAAGSIRCWGYNARGQLGNGTSDPGTTPVAVSGITTAVAISAGANHTCARLSNSTLRCWGDNHDGELGNGTTTDADAPVAVSGISTATGISAGFRHTCSLLSSGSVKCWGDNGRGQLGDGTATARSTPVTVTGITAAASVSAGHGFTCARLTDATVRCWGDNGSGQLGYTPLTSVRTTPVRVSGISTAVAIGAGMRQTCAVLGDGSVKCWGEANSSFGSTPVTVAGTGIVTAVGGGAYHTCALLTDQTVRCWGGMAFGGIGNGTNGSSAPVAVTGITTATSIGIGRYHACAVLADKTVRCWGYNSYGQLGDGTTYDRSSPVKVYGLTNVVAVAAGTWQTCALIEGGSVKCWGLNQYGQLGNGTHNDSLSPVTVSGITTAVQIAAGESDSCALLSGGAVKCWGDNSYNQLGQGTLALDDSATPVAVPGVTTAAMVSSLIDTSCATLVDHTVTCWGANGQADFGPGQLGDGSTAPSNAPVTVLGLGTATSVGVGGGHACALLADKTVRCWGQGEDGELGAVLSSGGTGSPPVDGVTGTLAAGSHQICVRATDAAGNTSAGTACATLTVLDKTAPTVTAPQVKLRSGVPLSGTSLAVTVAWTGTDNSGGVGINHYEIAKSTDGGATWTTVSSSISATSGTTTIASTGTVQWRVRGVDGAGNIGAWATGPVLNPQLVEETSSDISFTGTWATGSGPSYSGGGLKYTTAAGATASYTFVGRSIALVTTTAVTRGAVKIYVDGVLSSTVDLYSATTVYRAQAWAKSWTTAGTHTVKFVAVGTVGRPRVDLDALALTDYAAPPPPTTGSGAPGLTPPPTEAEIAAPRTDDSSQLAMPVVFAIFVLCLFVVGRRPSRRRR